MSNFDEQKSIIAEELNKKIPNLQCPICHSKDIILADGFFNHRINKEISGNLILGGPSIPTVAVICKNCGHFMEFAVGILGLLPNKTEEQKISEENNKKT